MEREKFEEFCSPEGQVRLLVGIPTGQRTEMEV